MKKTLLSLALALAVTTFNPWAQPVSLSATDTPIVQVEQTESPQAKSATDDRDFTDVEFKRADQPEQGRARGGDVVVVGSATVVVVVLVVVLILLL